jgi:glutamate-1-semialdehyde aminotransferase/3-oxoacyl-(acyl-carrier-protein) synthase/acyl carrier protein
VTDFISVIQEEIVKVTGIDGSQLDPETPFAGFGIESLQAVTIAVNLSEKLGREVPVTLFFDYPNIGELAQYLAKGTQKANLNHGSTLEYESIAIIGAACRFPGADSIEQFWYNQLFSIDAISETPKDRWNWKDYKHSAMRWGGFLSDLESFDEDMFGLSTPEARRMDPQQKLLLHTTHEAIENSGLSSQQLKNSRTGVFIGISSSDYSLQPKESSSVFDATGNAHSIAANRISYVYGLKGPSLSIDTACSSSLVAIHTAARSLQNRECDLAIVGGVNVILEPKLSLAFAEAGMLSPEGRCKTFSHEANGYVRGEGAGLVILQRAKEANPNRIIALIRGSATNHDGKTNGLTAPNGRAQEEVIREALANAGLSPKDIDFLEAHGTATSLGDPVEFTTLARVFGADRGFPLEVGAAKAFVGHLEAAAGICGLIKAAKAVQVGKWPRQIQFHKLNPQISLCDGVQVTSAPVEREPTELRAGVSSFGFGGTNAHVVLQSPPKIRSTSNEAPEHPLRITDSNEPLILAFSTTHPELLKDYCKTWEETLSVAEAVAQQMIRASQSHRLQFSHRLALWGKNRDEIVDALLAFQEGRAGRWLQEEVPKGFRPRLQLKLENTDGWDHHPKEGTAQVSPLPFLGRAMEEFGLAIHHFFPFSLQTAPEPGSDPRLNPQRSKAFSFSLQWSFVRSLRQWGVEPESIHSNGLGALIRFSLKKQISPLEVAELAAYWIRKESDSRLPQNGQEPRHWAELQQELSAEIKTSDSREEFNVQLSVGRSKQDRTEPKNSFTYTLNDLHDDSSMHKALAFLTLTNCRRREITSNDPILPNTPFKRKKAAPMETNSLVSELHILIADLLKVPKEDVGTDINLIDLGADSLLMLMALQNIKDRHGVTIAIPDVFKELNTIQAIAAYVNREKEKNRSPEMDIASPNLSSQIAQTLKDVQHQNRTAATQSPAPAGVQALIQQQLEIMRWQLSLLQGTEPPSIPSAHLYSNQTAVKKSENDSSSNEGKGVLGMWRATANHEHLPVSKQSEIFIADFVKRFAERTKGSKAHTQKFRAKLADNRLSAGFRPNLKEMIYTIVFRSGKGARFVDVDGNEYVDLSMGFGVNLFGHGPGFIEERIEAQRKLGYCVGPQAELAGIVAEKACRVLGKDRIVFLNSGTEAVMTALRLARAVTGRQEIVIFEGSYHGHADVVLARTSADGRSVPVAPGVPVSLVDGITVLSYGTPEAIDYIRKNGARIAGVLVEPVQSRFPELQPKDFLKELRNLTNQSGTALIFDEVIFGLRASPSGAQGLFDIEPDLSVYGKILGGGLPMGAVAGHSRFLNPIDGGFWSFGDESYPSAEMTFFAGTFCKHPLAMAATDAVLNEFLKNGNAITKALNERTKRFCGELEEILSPGGIRVNQFSSLFRLKSTSNLDLFYAHLNHKGVYVWEGRNMFLSTAHSDQDLEFVLRAASESLKELQDAGFFRLASVREAKSAAPSLGEEDRSRSQLSNKMHPFTPQEHRFLGLALDGEKFPAAHMAVAFELKGALDSNAMRKALNEIWFASELPHLRISLGEERQWMDGQPLPLSFEMNRASEADLKNRLKEFFSLPFRLESESCIRVNLLEVKPGKIIFALVAHHLPLDGWTISRFLERVTDRYNESLGEPKKEHQPWEPYIFHRRHYRESLLKPNAIESRLFWRKQKFVSPPLLLADYGKTEGHRVIYIFNKKYYEKIRRLAREEKVTPFLFLLTCFSKVLGKILSRDGLQISVPIAMREQERAEFVAANCVNLLPLDIALSPDLKKLLGEVKDQYLDKLRHGLIPIHEIEEIQGRDLSQIHFNFEPAVEEPKLKNLEFNFYPFPISQVEKPIIINVNDTKKTYYVELDFQFAALEFTQALRVFTEVERQINDLDRIAKADSERSNQ